MPIEKQEIDDLRQQGRDMLKDNHFGLTQDNIEELRAEFISLGGIVTELPDVGEVRDWTMVGVETDVAGVQTVTLHLMVLGKWFNIGSHTPSV